MNDRELARKLRKRGLSFSEINSKLPKERPKSTLSYWCKDLPLSEHQLKDLNNRFAPRLLQAREKSVKIRKEAHLRYLESISQRNIGIDNILDDVRTRKALLGALYLAEGSKSTNGSLMFGNSDPDIIRLYLSLLRSSFVIDERKFRCTIHARADMPLLDLEQYWMQTTAIPKEQFYPTRVDTRTQGKPTKKKNYRGVCRIDYFSADLFYEIMNIGNILTSSERPYKGL